MFGRRKKNNADLDWQPETAQPVMDSNQTSSMPPHPHQGHTAHHGHGASDVWTGLIHPRSVINFFRKSLGTIAFYALLMVFLGLAAYFLLPAKYGTKALILVDPRQPNITNTESVISVIGGDAAALTSYVEVMNSDGFLRKVVEELGVEADPEFDKAENTTELIEMFADRLSATRQGATYLVEVFFKSESAENAAKYANGVAEAFVRDQKDFRTSTNEEASRWLSERLSLLQANLKKSEDAVAAFQTRNGIVDGGAQGTLDNQQLTLLVNQLATVTTELAEAKARYQQASKDGVPASANTSQSNQFTNLDQLMQEQGRLRRQAAELGQTLGSRHPRILANSEQQRIISNQISQERRRLVQRAKQAYQTAEAKKISLERQLADARQRSIQLNKSMVELANLDRQATANRNLYEQFLARFKITDAQSQFQFSEARIVSKATVPVKSTKVSLSLVGPVLLVLGLGIGVLIALIKEAFAAPHPQTAGARMHAVPSHPLARDTQAADEVAVTSSHLDQPAEHYLATPPLERQNLVEDDDTADEIQDEIHDQVPAVELDTVNDQSDALEMASDKADHELRKQLRTKLAPTSDEGDVDQIDADGDTVVHLDRKPKPKQGSTRAQRAAAARLARQAGGTTPTTPAAVQPPKGSKSAVIITLPERQMFNEETMLDELLDEYHDTLEKFVGKEQNKDMVSLLVTSAQPGDGQDVTADLVREFAIDSGFHPVMISLQETSDRAARSSSGASSAERAPRVQEFEAFDLIPFVAGSRFSRGQGLGDALSSELASLITLCKENYGFVILETQQILDPETLEGLIELVDSSLIVIEEDEVTADDLLDWQHWASSTGVGLVLDQTQN